VVLHSRIPTRITALANAVVLVGGTEELVFTAQNAALSASGAHVLRAEVASSATVCAEVRPYAIILPNDVYEFGGAEFDALARDLDAGLVVVPSTIQLGVLAAMLAEEALRLG
jgi:hypothetical protein